MGLSEFVKTADWKNEKHVPAITAPATAKPGETVSVEIAVGKEIPHPNTLEHHIAWIALHFVPADAQTSVEIARIDLSSHGPDVFTAPRATIPVTLAKSGTFHATAYCNIHGLWTSSAAITVA